MDKAVYTQLVIDNLQGLLSQDDLDRLNAATLAHTLLAQERLRIEELWDATGNARPMVSTQDTDEMIGRVKRSGTSSSPVRPLMPRLVAIAAVLFVLASASIWILDELKPPTHYETAGVHTLPDGSVMTLRKGASVSDIDFGKNDRRLTTSGDVLFSVVKDVARPFIVEANNSITTVTGTEFMVRSSYGDIVSVSEGSVKVQAKNGTGTRNLAAGDAVTVDGRGPIYSLQHFGNLEGWREGVYNYRDVTMQDVINELATIFDTKVTLANTSMRTCAISATLRGDSVEQVLEVIAQTKGMQIVRQGSGYLLDGGTCE